jgi:hypothetical protein
MKASEKLRQLQIKSQRVLEDLANDGQFDYLLTQIPEQIRKRTRLGKGVDDKGGNIKLNPLTELYVERRKKLPLSGQTTPKKSNLTATGQMLESIKGTRQGLKFIFSFIGNRKDGKTNNEVASYAPKLGRPFFNLSNTEKNGISRGIRKLINDALKKLGA